MFSWKVRNHHRLSATKLALGKQVVSRNFRHHKVEKLKGFTIIELVVVIGIMGALAVVLLLRSDTYAYWEEQGAVRRLRETITFLFYQATIDGEHYIIEFWEDPETRQHKYRAGQFLGENYNVNNARSLNSKYFKR